MIAEQKRGVNASLFLCLDIFSVKRYIVTKVEALFRIVLNSDGFFFIFVETNLNLVPFFQPLRKIANVFIQLDASNIVFQVVGNDKQLQEDILDLNRIGQLFKKGIDSKGVNLNTLTESGFGYSQFTVKEKKKKNQPIGMVTLFDTGQFYKSFRLIIRPTYMDIVAQGNKGDSNLFEDFGDDITGLTDESLEILRSKLLPNILEYLKFRLL